MITLMMKCLLCLLICTWVTLPLLQAREFTNRNGVTIEATLLGLSGDQVRLKSKGSTYTLPISEFIEADQKHIRGWAKEQQAAALSQQQEAAFSKHGIKPAPGFQVCTHSEAGQPDSQFHVYIPKSYDGSSKLPLIISAHGANQKGGKEIKGWEKLADEFSCIVVAADNLSGARRVNFQEHCLPDLKKLESILKRVKGALAIDEKKVMHSGFSAGGYLTFFSMKLDDDITHLCFRCCNYSDHLKPYVGAASKQWKGRPIYWFYGTKDARSVLAEVDKAKAFLDASGCTLRWEKINGWSHRDDKRRAIEWLIKTPAR